MMTRKRVFSASSTLSRKLLTLENRKEKKNWGCPTVVKNQFQIFKTISENVIFREWDESNESRRWKRSERRADFLGAPMDPEKTYMESEVTATGKLQQVGGASPT